MSIEILIVDDHKIIRDVLKKIFEVESDITVIGTAANGLEAINKTAELTPDVVLMDIVMPKMNGFEATKRIKEKYPEIEIIILSMKYANEDIYRALEAGAIGYVIKESDRNELSEAIRMADNGYRYLSKKIDNLIIDEYIRGNRKMNETHTLNILSYRERQVLDLVTEGYTNKEIARKLHISKNTVGTYRRRIMKKLGTDTIQDLIKFAIRHDITTL